MKTKNIVIVGGQHCIGAGMHWWPIDKATLIHNHADSNFDIRTSFEKYVDRLTERKHRWRELVKHCPTSYQFLKENFYHGHDNQ